MKTLINLVFIIPSVMLLAGCTTPSYVEKTVAVTRDTEGKVTSHVETERVIQRLESKPIKLEYLTGLEPGTLFPRVQSPRSR